MSKQLWSIEDLTITLDVYMTLLEKGEISSRAIDASHDALASFASINNFHIHQGKPKANINTYKSYIQGFADYGSYRTGGMKIPRKDHKALWDQYDGERDVLKQEATSIRRIYAEMIKHPFPPLQAMEDGERNALEGKYQYHWVIERYRAKGLVKDKKKQFQNTHNKLFCEICYFNFVEVYGNHGEGFIECHHKTPVSQLNGTEKTSLEDLVLLCSNCHRMAHYRKDLSIEELKALLRKQ